MWAYTDTVKMGRIADGHIHIELAPHSYLVFLGYSNF